jgi:foldase protein PrsA
MKTPPRLLVVPVLVVGVALGASGCGGHAKSGAQATGGASSGTPAGSSTAQGSSTGARRPGAAAAGQALGVPKSASKAATKAAGRLPANVVATVAGQPITLAQYTAAERAQLELFPGGVPDHPPGYAHCMAALKREFAQLAKRMRSGPRAHTKNAPKPPSVSTLRKQCAEREQAARQGALTQLIQAAWSEQEARADHITVSAKEVDAAIATQRKSFKRAALYEKLLRSTHTTRAQLRERTRQMLLNQKLQARRSGPPVKVSDADVERYFHEHQSQFGLPERRDVQVILAKTQSQAQQAKRALQHGTGWKVAVKKWSIDPATKSTGGLLVGIVKGSQDPALSAAVFGGQRGALIGPVKAARGWYLARVTKITAAQTPQIAPYRQRIRMLLQNQAQARRDSAALQNYQRRWRAKTVCRPGYIVTLCANAPTSRG